MITASALFAIIEKEIADFSTNYQKKVTPRLWSLQENDYNGTFIFLNKNKKGLSLSNEQSSLLDISIKPKGKIVSETGIIEITSYRNGQIFIDNQDNGPIRTGETIQFAKCSVGTHKIELRNSNKKYSEKLKIHKGKISSTTILPKVNITKDFNNSSKQLSKGNLRLFYNGFEGKIYIDGESIGYLHKDKNILVKGIPTGEHQLLIQSKNKSLKKIVTIEKGKITFEPSTGIKPPIKKDVNSGYSKYNGYNGYNRW